MIQSEAEMKEAGETRPKLEASVGALAALETRRLEAAALQAELLEERAERAEQKAKGPASTPPKDPRAAALAAEVAQRIAAVDDEPDASGWSPKRDALLMHLRRDKGLDWSAISIPAEPGRFHSERRCQKRYALLAASAAGVRAAVAATRPEPADRDGLDWLARKGRLSPARRAAADYYRSVLRDAGDEVIKSCLNVTVGGPGVPGAVEAGAAGTADAKRELFRLRWVVLGGQADLHTVMDGVCGAGHTLRQLAGEGSDDQVKQRAKVLEAILMVALDLVARQMDHSGAYAA